MSAIRWIKLSTDLFNDEKIRFIEQLPEADSILTIWVKLLVLAGQKNMGGEIYFNDELPYTDEMLSAIFHRKVNTVRLALETFQKLRMIEIAVDQTIILCNWARHQNVEGLEKIRQQNLERKQRQRQQQRLLSRDCHVTVRDAVTPECVTAPPQNKNKI
jgi:predicted phage replisome organizer